METQHTPRHTSSTGDSGIRRLVALGDGAPPITSVAKSHLADPILIVDDQESNVRLLEQVLAQAGYVNIKSTTDPREVSDLYREFRPDLMLLDLRMPRMTGFDVMELLNIEIPDETYFPILVLTTNETAEAKRRALSMGAKDFLAKPLDRTETVLRIENLLETRWLHGQLRNHNDILEESVRLRTQDLDKAQVEILKRLALAAEFRDDVTGNHTERVGVLAGFLAGGLDLSDERVEVIRRAAPLHDIGKIGVPDSILLKPGKLTDEEFDRVKEHSWIGRNLLAGSRFAVLRVAEKIALTHHERWDGSGYPAGLAGEDIPLVGRIVSVVDVYDALTQDRPYKLAWPVDRAVEEIVTQRGKQFDPSVVEAFLEVFQRSDPRVSAQLV